MINERKNQTSMQSCNNQRWKHMASEPLPLLFSVALIRSLPTKDESSAWSHFDDQVLGRWCGVTGGSSACVLVWLYAYVLVRWRKIHPHSNERGANCSSIWHWKNFLFLSPLRPFSPPTFLIICSFTSTSISSVLTFSDDVNTQQPTYTSS